ncbi:prohead core scaffold protein [Synechococcus phage S-H38]|uniref:Prohead core scaffold protein n=1 Tax=Synechococcus phage S-H38 TaxID=2783673 RepID=A0A873WDF0_9CAUD|nr:head maturation protease [Synechococcus phage S-H38]QPB07988.1 prohead core scaffold protein [Synechococcus phage S-H38]
MMKLITENIEEIQVLTEESESGKKSHFIEGVFLQGNIKNRNNRYYDADILDREVAKYNESFTDKGRALGELGHPDGPIINLDRVSHKIVSLKREGNNFIGKAKLLETPMGKIAKNLLDEGVKLGVSSRGLGSITVKDGVNYVGEDFMLATAADIVADPSAPDAFVEGIMEGKEWVWESGVLREVELEKIKEAIDHSAVAQLQERKIAAFSQFLRSL